MKKNIPFFVYILKCSNNSLYTGITNDLSNRLIQHSEGKGSKYVRAHLPFELVYTEITESKSQALKREIEIKKMKRVEKEELVKQAEKRI